MLMIWTSDLTAKHAPLKLRKHFLSMFLPIYVIINLHTKKFCIHCLFCILFFTAIREVECDAFFVTNFIIYVLSNLKLNY